MKEALGPSFVQGSLSPEILKLPLGELKHAGINIKLTNPLNGGMDYNVDILIEKKPGLVIYEISEEGTRNERRCANIELWILEYSHITQYHSSFSSTGKQRNPRPQPIHHHHHRSDITFQVVSTRDWLQPILARKKSASTPLLLLYFSVFHRFPPVIYQEKLGKQSSFTRQNAYDVLCTNSSASQWNSTLEVDLRRTRKNVSILAPHLQEFGFIIGILEDALTALLLLVPDLPAPPLPPRPDVVMDPPVVQESLEPAPNSPGSERGPSPEREPATPPPSPVQAPLQTPSPVIVLAAPTVTTTPTREPPSTMGPTTPHLGQTSPEVARKSARHRPPRRSDFCGREFHLAAGFCSCRHRPPERRTRVPRPSTPSGEYSPPPPRCYCPTWAGAGGLYRRKKDHRHCLWPPPHRHKNATGRRLIRASATTIQKVHYRLLWTDATDRGTSKATATARPRHHSSFQHLLYG